MLQTDSSIPEDPTTAASTQGKPDEVMLKDVLNPSILIIILATGVLLILFCWYIFVLKPALGESNPMDIRLTKEPYSNTPVSREKFKTGVETQITANDLEPSNKVFEKEEKFDAVQRNNLPEINNPPQLNNLPEINNSPKFNKPTPRNIPIPRTRSTQRNTPIKSATSNIAISEKEPKAQTHVSPRPQNKEENIRVENIRAENMTAAEDTAQKIKSFAVKWKESILTPATQPICTQVQIAMNQCPN